MSLDVFVCVFTSVLLCFYVFVSERAGLFAGKTLRPFWARRRNEDSGRQHPPAGAQSREIRRKNFRFRNFGVFIGLKSNPCLAGPVSQSVSGLVEI